MDTATAATCSTAALPFTSSTIRKRHEAGSRAGLIFCHRCWLRCVSSTGWTNADASRGEYEVGLTNFFTSSVVLRTSVRRNDWRAAGESEGERALAHRRGGQ